MGNATDMSPNPVRGHMTIPHVRIETESGPLEVWFNRDSTNGTDYVTASTPSNSGTYPELRYTLRGITYNVNVAVWADMNGRFAVPVDYPSFVEGMHYVNITRFDNRPVTEPAYKAIVRSAMGAVNLAMAREPLLWVRGVRASVNNDLVGKLRRRAEIEAELRKLNAAITELGELEDRLIAQVISPVDPKYTEPGIHLQPVR